MYLRGGSATLQVIIDSTAEVVPPSSSPLPPLPVYCITAYSPCYQPTWHYKQCLRLPPRRSLQVRGNAKFTTAYSDMRIELPMRGQSIRHLPGTIHSLHIQHPCFQRNRRLHHTRKVRRVVPSCSGNSSRQSRRQRQFLHSNCLLQFQTRGREAMR